ncbi:DUF2393 family protein [Hydrogenimonas sp. SS33]|uniref:DUF2393 family protein n=1 Tax=Hydrogenimonas leucolamina TaxID=2954236 RepID=UPI00336C1291
MAELLRYYLTYTFHSMTKYDYMAIGWILFLALLVMFLGAFVKRRGLSYFLLFLGLVLLFAGPPLIKVTMDAYIRAAAVHVTKVKSLRFSDTLIVEGDVTNRGRIDYSSCDLLLLVYRPDTPLKSWAAWLKPKMVRVTPLDTPLPIATTKPFQLIVDHFNTEKDFNVSVIARCYP